MKKIIFALLLLPSAAIASYFPTTLSTGSALVPVGSTVAVTNAVGTGLVVTSTSTFPSGAVVSSTALPSPLSQGTTAAIGISSLRQVMVTGVPFSMIVDTYSTNIATGTADVPIISSATGISRTFLCGIMCYNTSATNSGVVLYQSTSGNIANILHPVGIPANNVPAGIWPGCSQPFFWGLPGGQIVLKPDATITNIKCHIQYYQSP